MKRAVLVLAALAVGCASSPWQSTESVPGGRLYVPKVYAPLLPGSIYPDRKVPVPAKGRPALILVCPAKGDCREKAIFDQAAQRGLIVLTTRSAGTRIAPRAEVDLTKVGTVIVALTSLKVEVPEPATATARLSSPSQKIFLAAVLDREPPEAEGAAVLKLYSPNDRNLLPDEAFRDAVEWLAGELGAR